VGHLYPVDVYLVLLAPELPESGVYYYHSLLHRLYEIRSGRLTGELAKAGLATPMLQRASALVLLTGVFPRNAQRFGNRGYRYTMLEAGMLAERFGQCASQLGLTASCAPEFVDDELNRLLGIDGIDEAVVLGIAVETKLT
jgi:SagB-type dehydrogenase family enzyme